MWFFGVEVGQEMRAPPPKKNPGSAPVCIDLKTYWTLRAFWGKKLKLF